MRAQRHPVQLLLALATVYVVWGSSFLFTRLAMLELPAALFAGTRFTTAGVVLLLIAHFFYRDAWPTGVIEWRHVIITGFFMVFVSSGLNVWALRYIPSNQSALLNGTTAFWIAGMGTFGPRAHPLSRGAILGLSIGFTGTVLMLIPKGHLTSDSILAQCAVLLACFSWAVGTVYYRSVDTRLSPLVFTAMQMLMGGLMLLCFGVAHGDLAAWDPSPRGWVAWLYLTFASSCLAYTAYGWLSVNTRPTVLGTYSYVNPAIAAFVGWRFLHEELSLLQLAGMLVIIFGVGMLTLPGSMLTDRKTLEEPKEQ